MVIGWGFEQATTQTESVVGKAINHRTEMEHRMTKQERKAAYFDWLELYTWMQIDGSIDFSKPRPRPEGLAIDQREIVHGSKQPETIPT